MKLNKSTVNDAWAKAQTLIKADLPLSKYNDLIAPLAVASFSDEIINIHTKDDYSADWLNQRMGTKASKHLTGILNQPVQILFVSNGSMPANADLSPGRKAQLSQAYGETRASVIQPHKTLYISHYFWKQWRPRLGKSASDVVIACRSLCFWNIQTGEIRNRITTDRLSIANLASCSGSSVDRALSSDDVRKYFVRKKIARFMTSDGPRNQGLILKVRMDDPLIPEHQARHKLPEPLDWLDPYYPE